MGCVAGFNATKTGITIHKTCDGFFGIDSLRGNDILWLWIGLPSLPLSSLFRPIFPTGGRVTIASIASSPSNIEVMV